MQLINTISLYWNSALTELYATLAPSSNRDVKLSPSVQRLSTKLIAYIYIPTLQTPIPTFKAFSFSRAPSAQNSDQEQEEQGFSICAKPGELLGRSPCAMRTPRFPKAFTLQCVHSRQWGREHMVLQTEQSHVMHKRTHYALLWNRAANGI